MTTLNFDNKTTLFLSYHINNGKLLKYHKACD